MEVPWERCQALFLGGTTDWKLSHAAADLAAEAKRRGRWLHLGRCNSRKRLAHAYALGCDSVDGSGFSRWPEHNIPRALHWLAELHDLPGSERRGRGGLLPAARRLGAELLDVPGWVVEAVRQSRREYQLWARYAPEPDACPGCGASRWAAGQVHRHGARRLRLRDLPRNGRRVLVWAERIRYRCQACGHTFVQPLPDAATGCRLTRRLAEYLRRAAAARSCRDLARETGLDEKTVRQVVSGAVLHGHPRPPRSRSRS